MQAGNRVGKSEAAAYEAAIHALGDYPDWWEGRRFDTPVRILCAGVSNTTVRDIMQSKLIGEPTDRDGWGSGMIPKARLGVTARKAGIPDALSSVLIKHKSGGWSKITFTSYESGKESFMGTSMHYVNLDEEPPMDIFSQAVRAVVDTNGIISITATPENGVTELIRSFMNGEKAGQYLQNVTWNDCPHLTPEVQEAMLEQLAPHEREMRSKGIPVLGSGLIYPVNVDSLTCEPFDVPDHWLRIAAIDFGYEHPAAWVSIAWDREEDVLYVVDCLKMEKMTPEQQMHKIRLHGGKDIPCAFPADGMTAEKGSGIALKQQYEGMYFLPEPFTNPPDPVSGKANRSVEAGLMAILDMMKGGRFKIFQHLEELLQELRMYHRKDGKIVKKFDDAVDAMRYAVQSRLHGETKKHSFKAYIPSEHDNYQDEMVAY
jgi:phage terminase large subunit-like protein